MTEGSRMSEEFLREKEKEARELFYRNWTLSKPDTKLDYTLIPLKGLEEIAKVMEFGNRKYPDEGWDDVSKEKHIQSLYRHLIEILKGIQRDDESGLNHAAHLATRAIMLADLVARGDNE